MEIVEGENVTRHERHADRLTADERAREPKADFERRGYHIEAMRRGKKHAALDAHAAFRLNLPNSRLAVGARKGAPTHVSTYTVHPGARMLWCLRRRATDVRCIMYPHGMPVEVQILQDRDIVLTELFQEEWLAMNWAQAYCDRLKLQGWNDSPAA